MSILGFEGALLRSVDHQSDRISFTLEGDTTDGHELEVTITLSYVLTTSESLHHSCCLLRAELGSLAI